jgi:hypothetical protein
VTEEHGGAARSIEKNIILLQRLGEKMEQVMEMVVQRQAGISIYLNY